MVVVIPKPNNQFIISLDDRDMQALMMIVAGADLVEIQSVGELIRYEIDYMVENYHLAIKDSCSPPFDEPDGMS